MGAQHNDIKQSLRMIDWDLSTEDLPRGDRAVVGRARSTAADGAPPQTVASDDLRAIPFEPVAATPLPEMWESDTEFAWLEFDAATVSMDLATRNGRAEHAELLAAQSTKRPRS